MYVNKCGGDSTSTSHYIIYISPKSSSTNFISQPFEKSKSYLLTAFFSQLAFLSACNKQPCPTRYRKLGLYFDNLKQHQYHPLKIKSQKMCMNEFGESFKQTVITFGFYGINQYPLFTFYIKIIQNILHKSHNALYSPSQTINNIYLQMKGDKIPNHLRLWHR